MGSREVSWSSPLNDGDRHAAGLQVALDVAWRVLDGEKRRDGPDPGRVAGDDPLADLVALTELTRWLSGVRDELLYATRLAHERRDLRGPGSWQDLASALGVTRTPARQRFELVAEGKRRGGGLPANLLTWDTEHREAPPETDRRPAPR